MKSNVRKWNFQKRQYEPYSVPDDWYISTYETDMDKLVNCAQCGRKMTFGQGFTSRQIHTQHGMGFAVCEDCYAKEWRIEKKFREEQKND